MDVAYKLYNESADDDEDLDMPDEDGDESYDFDDGDEEEVSDLF